MRHTVVAVVAVLCSVLAACTSGQGTGAAGSVSAAPSAPESGTAVAAPAQPEVIDPATVDTSHPDAVAEAVAIASVTWDTTTQTSPFDAIRTMTALLTPELAAQYPDLGPDAHPATDPTWASARDLGAYSVPDVRTAQDTHAQPADTATTAYRVYDATWTWHGHGGETMNDPRTRYLYVTLALQPDGRWLVSGFDTIDV